MKNKIQVIQENYRTNEKTILDTDLEYVLKNYASDGTYGEEGQMERLASKAENTRQLVFKLVAIMADKGLIDSVEILNELLPTWHQSEERILIDGKTLAEHRKALRKDVNQVGDDD